MSVVRYGGVGEFWGVVERWYGADPVRHTVAMTVLSRLRAVGVAPEGILLVGVHRGGALVGAVFQLGAWPMALSGLPVDTHDEVVEHLVARGESVGRVHGPLEVVESFVERWSRAAGTTVSRSRFERLYRLGGLVAPVVSGRARFGTAEDIPLLGRWCDEFSDEALGVDERMPDGAEFARDAIDGGRGAPIWVDGMPVAMAMVTPPVAGMSRIGPVYTSKDHRGNGYGSAVTAAAAVWAAEQGARDVLLFADQGNPVANSIYQRIGFRPVLDAVEAVFAGPNTLGV
ncbi:Acetyltransferase (GNAT) family protein [Actinokineospora globicatena]|nr:Acetyltransferase (GNAT) family protein [Actinokineospora globicatena]GLW80405.1 putative acetyltransferase [Actinokineospora globicatena]GLW87234.1 putative acetyltransferase [Actinokineospora globicatena]